MQIAHQKKSQFARPFFVVSEKKKDQPKNNQTLIFFGKWCSIYKKKSCNIETLQVCSPLFISKIPRPKMPKNASLPWGLPKPKRPPPKGLDNKGQPSRVGWWNAKHFHKIHMPKLDGWKSAVGRWNFPSKMVPFQGTILKFNTIWGCKFTNVVNSLKLFGQPGRNNWL